MKSHDAARRLVQIEEQLAGASSYVDWKAAALEHDQLSGKEAWKQAEKSNSYDHADIARRLEDLRGLRVAGDDIGLLFALNEGIHGNMGGMGRSTLYGAAKFGTKQLIVDYVDELTRSLEYISALPESVLTPEDRLDFFKRAALY